MLVHQLERRYLSRDVGATQITVLSLEIVVNKRKFVSKSQRLSLMFCDVLLNDFRERRNHVGEMAGGSNYNLFHNTVGGRETEH